MCPPRVCHHPTCVRVCLCRRGGGDHVPGPHLRTLPLTHLPPHTHTPPHTPPPTPTHPQVFLAELLQQLLPQMASLSSPELIVVIAAVAKLKFLPDQIWLATFFSCSSKKMLEPGAGGCGWVWVGGGLGGAEEGGAGVCVLVWVIVGVWCGVCMPLPDFFVRSCACAGKLAPGPGHLTLYIRAVAHLDMEAPDIKATPNFSIWINSFLTAVR